MAAAHTWWNLLLGRFLLGFAVGAKSTTTPVYGAECAPANIRGALVMMWQMWTAFGIMLGYIASVAFMDVSHATIPGFNWRLMLGSTAIPFILSELTVPSPFFVCIQVYLCPESPRWYMIRNRYRDAYQALCKLRPSEFQAARDLYYIHSALKVEEKLREGKHLWREMFTVPRNRRAAQSSFFVMFMQQPLYIRDIGMSFATATTWGFNFIVSLTWLPLRDAFSVQGAFGWYAAWNFFGWIFCYFCLPETKALSLEELDQVFSVPTRKHINHYRGMMPWYVKKYILRRDVPPQKQLYDYE
ncbi:hypothetical protein APSETT444_003146 [Aspergillus pseudonomiae]